MQLFISIVGLVSSAPTFDSASRIDAAGAILVESPQGSDPSTGPLVRDQLASGDDENGRLEDSSSLSQGVNHSFSLPQDAEELPALLETDEDMYRPQRPDAYYNPYVEILSGRGNTLSFPAFGYVTRWRAKCDGKTMNLVLKTQPNHEKINQETDAVPQWQKKSKRQGLVNEALRPVYENDYLFLTKLQGKPGFLQMYDYRPETLEEAQEVGYTSMLMEDASVGPLLEEIDVLLQSGPKHALYQHLLPQIVKALIDAVGVLIDEGLVHRDLRLENILVDGARNLQGCSARPSPCRFLVGGVSSMCTVKEECFGPADNKHMNKYHLYSDVESSHADDLWSVGIMAWHLYFGVREFWGNMHPKVIAECYEYLKGVQPEAGAVAAMFKAPEGGKWVQEFFDRSWDDEKGVLKHENLGKCRFYIPTIAQKKPPAHLIGLWNLLLQGDPEKRLESLDEISALASAYFDEDRLQRDAENHDQSASVSEPSIEPGSKPGPDACLDMCHKCDAYRREQKWTNCGIVPKVVRNPDCAPPPLTMITYRKVTLVKFMGSTVDSARTNEYYRIRWFSKSSPDAPVDKWSPGKKSKEKFIGLSRPFSLEEFFEIEFCKMGGMMSRAMRMGSSVVEGSVRFDYDDCEMFAEPPEWKVSDLKSSVTAYCRFTGTIDGTEVSAELKLTCGNYNEPCTNYDDIKANIPSGDE